MRSNPIRKKHKATIPYTLNKDYETLFSYIMNGNTIAAFAHSSNARLKKPEVCQVHRVRDSILVNAQGVGYIVIFDEEFEGGANPIEMQKKEFIKQATALDLGWITPFEDAQTC